MVINFSSQLQPEIQYGGRQTGDQYHSVCILRIQSQHGLYGKQGQNNYGLPQISWVLELHDNVPDTTSGKWKMEIQDGGCQTGYEYICRL